MKKHNSSSRGLKVNVAGGVIGVNLREYCLPVPDCTPACSEACQNGLLQGGAFMFKCSARLPRTSPQQCHRSSAAAKAPNRGIDVLSQRGCRGPFVRYGERLALNF
jgi:hypothetical protein